jgi:hypothetical protein
LNSLSGGAQRLGWGVDQTQHAQGSVGQRGEDLGQARPLGVMPVLVPPAVFEEMKAVFHLPVVANVGLQLARRDLARIEAGGKIAAFTRERLAAGRAHFAIDTEDDLTMSKVQALADIVGDFQVEPQSAGFDMEPLFSVT